MVRNYNGFRKQIEQFVVLRSRNYVNTDCNIDMLLHIVFAEIATEVKLMWDVQQLVFNADQLTYDLPKYEVLEASKDGKDDEEYPEEDDNAYASKYFTDIYDIVDMEGNDISSMFTQVDSNTLMITQEILDANIDSEFQVLRSVVPSVKSIEPWLYQLLLKPMIEGIMFNIQDSIPSQVDGQLGNLQYQRFFNAKKILKKLLPQRRWIVTKQVGTNIVEEGVL